ncbi:MAG: hypothetical protein IJO43_03725 [Bacilli bacterium]|nr:hypothetical protein [Bacilli bacterium]
MSRVGTIILDNNYANPRVIIVDKPNCLRALDLTTDNDPIRTFQLKEEDVFIIKYRGKQLDGRSVSLASVSGIYNLNIREIGVLSKNAYYMLLRKFNSHQVMQGANSLGFLEVREDVQGQILELGKRLIK